MHAAKELEEVGVASLRAHPSSLQLWLIRLGRLKCSSCGRGTKTKMAALDKAFKEALKNIPVKVKRVFMVAQKNTETRKA